MAQLNQNPKYEDLTVSILPPISLVFLLGLEFRSFYNILPKDLFKWVYCKALNASEMYGDAIRHFFV